MVNTTKQKIVSATIEVIAEVGLENTTTKKIAERAEISESVMYKYFKGKYDILQGSKEVINKELSKAINMALMQADSCISQSERNSVVSGAYIDYFSDNPSKAVFFDRVRHSAYKFDAIKQSDAEVLISFLFNEPTAYTKNDYYKLMCELIIDSFVNFVVLQFNNGQEINCDIKTILAETLGKKLD